MSDDEINVYSDRDEGDDVEEVVAADADEPDDDEGSNNADDQSAEPNADEDLDESQVDDDRSMGTSRDGEEDDDDGKSEPPQDDISAEPTSPKSAATPSSTAPESGKKKKRGVIPPHARKGRAPAVKGLTIPFRTVKKAMKLDPDIPIVQNEAAIMTTMAAELFLKSLAQESQRIAKQRGRNTIRYEDVAEARSNDPSLAFLEKLLP